MESANHDFLRLSNRMSDHTSKNLSQTFSIAATTLKKGRCIFRSAYTADGGRLHILHGITESLWHSISHTLSIDVFKVHAFPSRIITAAYAFLVLILTNTYTANLAAFLTVDQLDTQISDIVDLRGKAVVTIKPYVDRLYTNHRIVATDKEGTRTSKAPALTWSRLLCMNQSTGDFFPGFHQCVVYGLSCAEGPAGNPYLFWVCERCCSGIEGPHAS